MTFEEFFKKKRIDLDALQKGEPSLFSEFKTHYEQMGEKSFDHTKKYWFNKIRREFPLAVEVKTEKPKIENQLAEQTVTEALLEAGAPPAPKLGFVPKFRAANIPKPVEEDKPEAIDPPAPVPKLGFVPKFKAANLPKPIAEDKPETDEPAKDTAAAVPPKLGFKPKFKAANMPKPVTESKEETVEPPTENTAEAPAENKAPQPYKPRFNMKNIPPKPKEE